MKLQIINVEHGACALLIDDYGKKVMFDCGHNATTGWYPGSALIKSGIDRIEALFVTNYDEDHVSGIVDLFGKVAVPRIWRNASVSPAMIRHLKSEDGMGKGIDFLVATLETWTKTGVTAGISDLGLTNVSIQSFCNTIADFDDENNLSMAVVVTCHGVKFLFTGDLEQAGWLKLLGRADFQTALAGLDVLFASHHGRENGCCDELFKYCTPRFVVISDKAKGFQTQETTDWYRNRARGGVVGWDSDTRYVLTTRKDGDFAFDMSSNGNYTVNKF